MLSILLLTSLVMSTALIMMKHPVSMGTILLLQTTSIALMMASFSPDLWFSYILFLIMVGGMLVLFMYMTSVASNEKFKISNKTTLMMTLPLTAYAVISYYPKMTIKTEETTNLPLLLNTQMSMNKFINLPLSFSLMLLMMYLLLALVVSVKITNFKQGSIRQMN
uniref:NADH-ubiquinone oxidoreductase chain 6 n=1 Tax=Morphostenophanes yunnanus TaxID=2823840 RepID=A0A8F4SM41_9CUCU|nr:NADH dehydrogenase subunit 6 [Morphostenophanes yunnanus]QXF60333.1 NADH dehydrogenase subunit 6 [Morphostenophanes yunnanus]